MVGSARPDARGKKTLGHPPGATSTDRRIAVLLAAALALSTVVPTATAHTCSKPNGDCGPCTEGEDHEHNDESGQCSSTASSATPGFEAVLVAAGLLAAAGLVTLRRR